MACATIAESGGGGRSHKWSPKTEGPLEGQKMGGVWGRTNHATHGVEKENSKELQGLGKLEGNTKILYWGLGSMKTQEPKRKPETRPPSPTPTWDATLRRNAGALQAMVQLALRLVWFASGGVGVGIADSDARWRAALCEDIRSEERGPEAEFDSRRRATRCSTIGAGKMEDAGRGRHEGMTKDDDGDPRILAGILCAGDGQSVARKVGFVPGGEAPTRVDAFGMSGG